MPGSGYYAATKHALEGYTESLRYEVEPLGIGVCLVEPPVLRLGSSTLLQTRETIAAYASLRSARVKAISEEGNTGLDPAKVVAQIAGIVEHGARKMRYRVGAAASFVPVMKTLMPHRLFSGMMMRAMGLNNSSEEAKQP